MSFCWAAIIEAMTDEIEQFRVNGRDQNQFSIERFDNIFADG